MDEYGSALEYLHETSRYGSVPGLAATRELLRRIGNPQEELSVIHVAGTNGKGSVLSFLASMLRKSGYQIGQYTSPAVFEYRERYQINGTMIEKEDFAELLGRVKKEAEAMKEEGFSHPTVFEIETSLAFLYFAERKCDYVLIETGMGGLLDATNVISHPLASVITAVSIDHTQFLGDTLEEIAAHKAGIIKQKSLVISSVQQKAVENVLRAECKKKQATFCIVDGEKIKKKSFCLNRQIFDYKEFRNVEIRLNGACQILNAATALETVKQLRAGGIEIPDQAVKEGMCETKWPGRLAVVAEDPLMVIDGAHNEDAAKRLEESIESYFPDRRIIGVMGVFKDKDYEKMVRLIGPYLEKTFVVDLPDQDRTLPKEVLAEAFRKENREVVVADSISEAVQAAKNEAHSATGGMVLVFGSLSFLKEIQA